MRRHSTSVSRRISTALCVMLTAVAPTLGSRTASAAPAGDEVVVAFEIRGIGNGHGRGMSQWGAYGRALAGHSWQQILDAYYGGTVPGTRVDPALRIRLTKWDGVGTFGVIATTATARWDGGSGSGGGGYQSLYASRGANGLFSVYGATSGRGCPGVVSTPVPKVDLQLGSTGAAVRDLQTLLSRLGIGTAVDGDFGPRTKASVETFQGQAGLTVDGLWRAEEWTAAEQRLAADGGAVNWAVVATGVTGPIRFSTTQTAPVAAGDTLGACEPDGSITHYRGVVEFTATADGNRIVNEVELESYLRGVVPRESPSSWGDGGNGAGMNALRAQAVAARSYVLSQNRYTGSGSYARTCDTTSCQVYGGAATRGGANAANPTILETANADRAITDTATVVRLWPATAAVVSTEFSASNGPRTAGGQFPAVDDPFDDQPGNPNHRWTRIIDADVLVARYQLGSAGAVRTALDANSTFDGIWANKVDLGTRSVSAWDFRNDFDLPAPGFEIVAITRGVSHAGRFAYIGDSVGVGIAGAVTSPLRVLLDGVHADQMWDSRSGRPTGGGGDDGVAIAATVPADASLVVVELGYNDAPARMAERIDAVMAALRAQRVARVAWVTVSERRATVDYATANAAIRAARERWPEMVVFDWADASSARPADRWFADDVHLTATGNAEFSRWLRDRIVEVASEGYVPPRRLAAGEVLRVPVGDRFGVPAAGVPAVALNVTAVAPVGPGFLRVWECGRPEPETSSVNFVSAGAVEPNAVIVAFDGDAGPGDGQVCVTSLVATDVIVDVSGWFSSGVSSAVGRLVDTRDTGRVNPGRVNPGDVLRVPVRERYGVPAAGATGVVLNVTAVAPVGPGFLRVWECGRPEPETSSVNFVSAGAVEPNAVIVAFDGDADGDAGGVAGATAPGDGDVCVTSLVTTDVVVDVAGWFSAGVRSGVGRLVDTRNSTRLAAGATLAVPVADQFGVPTTGVAGVAVNVTAVAPSGPGFLRVWECGTAEPSTSSVNYVAAGAVEPNAVVVAFDGDAGPGDGRVCVSSLVASDVVVDLTGWFDGAVHSAVGRLRDTRVGSS